jgi:hypothetical protein
LPQRKNFCVHLCGDASNVYSDEDETCNGIDNDGLLDRENLLLRTNPLLHDSNSDGYSDRYEIHAGITTLNNAYIPVPALNWFLLRAL